MSYDPTSVLAAIDDNLPIVLGFGLLTAAATFTYLVESVRLAFAHRAYPAALAAVGWFAVHDLGFVLQRDKWFGEYGHWWTEFWWYALVATSGIEFFLVGLVIHFGHRELLPQVSRRSFAAIVVAATIAIACIWAFVKQGLDDDLYLISFPVTAIWAVPFGTGILLRRRSQRGQSVRQPVCVALIMIGFQGAFWNLDPFFRSSPYLLLTAAAVGWCAFEVWLMSRFPAFDPDRDSFGWPAEQSSLQPREAVLAGR